MTFLRLAAACALPLWLAACAVPRAPAPPEIVAPTQWYAPMPHGGRLADLVRWWRELDDAVLADLIDQAQTGSPTIAAAQARIAQARAARAASRAALLPSVDGAASLTRGNAQAPLPLATTAQVGAEAGWEIDLFGGRQYAIDAAQARLRSAEAGWHDARITVAAETAASYFRLRACQRLLEVSQGDAGSRAETARLAQLSADAGFTPPANAALARAAAADSAARLIQQRAQCEIELKTLVALTGLAEPALAARLAQTRTAIPGTLFGVAALPARVLAQRPDVFQAEQAIAAASAEVGAARADRYPRLSLSGSIRAGLVRTGGDTVEAQTWAIGPLAVSVPLFDGGRREANVDAAIGRYQEAVALYRGRVRSAVSEVEQALVAIDAALRRGDSVRTAARNFQAYFDSVEARYRSGLASLVELEDARRDLFAAQTAVVGLERDLQSAWVSLYRAAGGGWERDASALAAQP
ncbi:efflux transporter outer membrane subunit [Ramlibacter rhizophilus]|uniref:Efflux transporter outer membrane subunit n=1 Tax=Ramlibacter rhizophilus TaxID=1781167 RepID=A0A4Z0BGH6_9BURK|nr:efflux transporter outer membrane subunit [Ramlibacter rhizophilus]TFY97880.1 efflux transporter outer membrane subunit [Ramlibacter rhizophilus]